MADRLTKNVHFHAGCSSYKESKALNQLCNLNLYNVGKER